MNDQVKPGPAVRARLEPPVRLAEDATERTMMDCSRIGCRHKATKYPLVSFAAKANPTGPRPEFKFPLPVCDAHADPDPALYVSDAGWAQIVSGFTGRGLAEPDRTTLRVDFVPCQ